MQMAFGIGILIFIWLYNLIRYRETPCTTKDKFELAIPDTVIGDEDDRKLPETPDGPGQRRSTIAVTENFENSGLRLVSVVSGEFWAITADETDTKSSASASSATGLSSLDPTTDEETDATTKPEV